MGEMIMPSREIEEFAKILVKEVRDATIEECDSNFRPDVRDVIAQRWRKALGSGDADRIADVLIPDIVDATISYLLRALDQEMLPLTFKASNGKTVDLPVSAGTNGSQICQSRTGSTFRA